MDTPAVKTAIPVFLILLALSIPLVGYTSGNGDDDLSYDLGKSSISSEVETFDWTGWDRDIDENRIDDRLQSEIPDYEIMEGRVGINVHIDGRPEPTDVDEILDLLDRLGLDPEFVRIGTFSTAIYLIVDRDMPDVIEQIRLPDRITMMELRPIMRGTLDISAPAITAGGSTRYSPFTAEDLGYTGDGVTIAIIDSGVDNTFHESLQGKFVYGVDFTGFTTVYGADPQDTHGHGTHCAGVAMGTGGQSERYAGVAPGADLVDLRHSISIGDFTGNADNALEWILEYHEEYDIRVVSCSWGSTSTSSGKDTTSRLVNQVVEAGVVVVVASGNDGISGLPSPAAADGAITVGAFGDQNTIDRSDDSYQTFSNYGPRSSDGDSDSMDELKPDVLAPGRNIISAAHDSVTGYVSMTGTSMSCPHVSGVVALILEANPDLTPEQIKEIIRDTAYQRNPASRSDLDPKYNYRSGWGDIDSYGAVKRAEDLLSFRLDAPSQVRQAQTLNINITGHLTKTGYDTVDDELRIELSTPYSWSKPRDIEFDPGVVGVGYFISGPYKSGDRWEIVVNSQYNDSMEECDPILKASINPAGIIGDTETITGSVSINSINGVIDPRNVTISYEAEPPDLSIIASSIFFSDNLPQGGDEITITVKVNNTGGSNTDNCLIRIIDGPERTGRTIGEERIMVPSGGYAMAEIPWVTSAGIHTITAIADPDNEIFESVEDNNSAEKPITVRGINPPPMADLVVTPGEGSTLTQFLFDGSGSDDTNLVGGNVVSYHFDFGDGEDSGWIDSPTVIHRYSEPGAFTASLVVMDNGGAESSNQAAEVLNVSSMSSDSETLYLTESGYMTGNGSSPFTIDISSGTDPQTLGRWIGEDMDRTKTLLYPAIFKAVVSSTVESTLELAITLSAGDEISTSVGTFEIPGNNQSTVLNFDLLEDEAVVPYNDHITLEIEGISNTSMAVLSGGMGGSSLVYSYYVTSNSIPVVDAGPDREVKAEHTIGFSGEAMDLDGSIEYLRWDVDGDGVWDAEGSDAYSFDYEGYAVEGVYNAVLEARDDSGYWGRDSARMTVRPADYNYPPSIVIDCENGTIASGLMTILGTADDDYGIDKVEIRIEDPTGYIVVGWTDAKGGKDWSYVWDTTSEPPGDYTFMARAFDGERYSPSASCLLIIDNPFNRPEIVIMEAEPDPLPNDGATPLVISALIEDIDLPDDRLFVEADLSGIGGPVDLPMLDNGLGDDPSGGDGEYTGSYTPSDLILTETANITVTVTDSFDEIDVSTLTISIISSLSVSVEMEDRIMKGQDLTVEVIINPSSPDLFVILDPEGLMGINGVELNDEGIDGDRLSDDGTFSGTVMIADEPGDYDIEIRITNRRGDMIWSGTEAITITSPSQGGGDNPISPGILIGMIVLILLILIIVGVVFFFVSKGRGIKETESPYPEGYGTGSHAHSYPHGTSIGDEYAVPEETTAVMVLESSPSI